MAAIIACPHCGRQDRQVKAGMAGGVQRYKCVPCGRRYSPDKRPREYPATVRDKAMELRAGGTSIRQVARQLGVSPQTVSVWDRTAPAAEMPAGVAADPVPEVTLKPRVTIADVARRAGVSTATVSNYLNDKGRMSQETRRRVDEAMKALYFTPNALVRAIRSRRTHTLGLVSYGIYELDRRVEFSIVAPLLAAINRAADRANYDVLLYTGWPHRSRSRAGSDFLNGQIDGLLWVSPQSNVSQLRYAAAAGLPIMALLTSKVPEGVGYVVSDNAGGERDMVAYLVRRGHRRIAFLGSRATSDFIERATGYRAGLAAAGLPFDPELNTTEMEIDEPPARLLQIIGRWMTMPDRPTAIVVASDGFAETAINVIREQGWRVPEDVAVTGFDDLPAAEHLCGGITTIRQPFGDIGRIAVERLDALIHGAPVSKCRITVPVSLVIRASTEPPVSTYP